MKIGENHHLPNGCGGFAWEAAFHTCDIAVPGAYHRNEDDYCEIKSRFLPIGGGGFAWDAAFHTCDTAF